MAAEITTAISNFILDPRNAAQVGGVFTAVVGLLSGLLGFGLNAALQRRADQRKYDIDRQKEDDKRAHEIHVTQATLAAELDSVVRTYDRELQFIEGHPGTYVPVGFFEGVKSGRITVGILPADQVRLVMNAYYTYQIRVGYIARNGTSSGVIENNTIPYDFESEGRKEHHRQWLTNDLREIVRDAKAARDSLQGYKG